MTFEPNPRQALFVWLLITAETPEEREPKRSKMRPSNMSKAEKDALIEHGFAETEKRGRSEHFMLTDRAWAWAGQQADVSLSKSQETAPALQGLIRRLIPFLKRNEIPLAEIFAETSAESEEAASTVAHATSGVGAESDLVESRILRFASTRIDGTSRDDVRLADLRAELRDVPRDRLDEALRRLHEERRIILSRDDNSARLTEADRDAALLMGDAPRHLFYLKD